MNKREPYCILGMLESLSVDAEEYEHLKLCLYRNELGSLGPGDESDAEIHAEKEYWKLGEMDTEGPGALRRWANPQNVCVRKNKN